MAIFNTRLRTKKDSESNWVSNNPILLDGEEVLSVQSDGSLRRKVGDGTSHYTALGYVGEHVAEADHAAEADQADYATSCGTASRATQLDSVRKINGVSFNGTKDITIYDPHITSTVTKRLEAEGWYRIASKTVAGTNDGGLLLLTRSYNSSNAENYVFAFTQGHKRFTLNPISCDVGNQHFTKLRYIYNDDKTPCYIEVYYAFSKANNGAVSVISNTGTYTSEAFTVGSIPDGYSVKEFEIPTVVEAFTASDKAVLDGISAANIAKWNTVESKAEKEHVHATALPGGEIDLTRYGFGEDSQSRYFIETNTDANPFENRDISFLDAGAAVKITFTIDGGGYVYINDTVYDSTDGTQYGNVVWEGVLTKPVRAVTSLCVIYMSVERTGGKDGFMSASDKLTLDGLGASLGNVETALDAILTIQGTLIGEGDNNI